MSCTVLRMPGPARVAVVGLQGSLLLWSLGSASVLGGTLLGLHLSGLDLVRFEDGPVVPPQDELDTCQP